jgi:hypothetical protein
MASGALSGGRVSCLSWRWARVGRGHHACQSVSPSRRPPGPPIAPFHGIPRHSSDGRITAASSDSRAPPDTSKAALNLVSAPTARQQAGQEVGHGRQCGRWALGSGELWAVWARGGLADHDKKHIHGRARLGGLGSEGCRNVAGLRGAPTGAKSRRTPDCIRRRWCRRKRNPGSMPPRTREWMPAGIFAHYRAWLMFACSAITPGCRWKGERWEIRETEQNGKW